MIPGRSRHPSWQSLPGTHLSPDKHPTHATIQGWKLTSHNNFTWPTAPHESTQGQGAAHCCHHSPNESSPMFIPTNALNNAFANFCFSGALAPANVAKAPHPEYPVGAWHALPSSFQPSMQNSHNRSRQQGQATEAKCTVWTSCFVVGLAYVFVHAFFAARHPATWRRMQV